MSIIFEGGLAGLQMEATAPHALPQEAGLMRQSRFTRAASTFRRRGQSGPQWRLLPCNRRFWGINEGLMGALGGGEYQGTMQKCLTRRVLSRCPITFEQNRSKKHEHFPLPLPAVFGRF